MLIQNQANSTCIRCGKIRIFSKKWKDKENGKGSMVTHEETICPDHECQKIVDEKFKEIRDRRELAEERKRYIVLARSAKSKTGIKFEGKNLASS
ncbi:MAG: hypothetical protein Q7S45_01630 [Candidatus Curtissbacteria bacterium]|nr:hypothetical protein [Candidatus Curtissbacteria bacterium]